MCRPISECFITSFIFFRMVSVFECIKEGKENYVCIIMNKRLVGCNRVFNPLLHVFLGIPCHL